jgi:hypothetical protein
MTEKKSSRYAKTRLVYLVAYANITSQVTDSDIIDLFELVLNSPYINTLVRQYVLTAISKLSARFAEINSSTSSSQQDRIAVLLASFSSNLELEIQQRAVEFGSLFTKGEIMAGVLERMPPPEIRATIMGTGRSLVPPCLLWMTRIFVFRRRLESKGIDS